MRQASSAIRPSKFSSAAFWKPVLMIVTWPSASRGNSSQKLVPEAETGFGKSCES